MNTTSPMQSSITLALHGTHYVNTSMNLGKKKLISYIYTVFTLFLFIICGIWI